MTEARQNLQAQLEDVESQLRILGGDDAQAIEELDPATAGARDPEDVAAALTARQENEALIATLQARRDALREQIADA